MGINQHTRIISELMLEKKATNIKIFDVRKISTFTDYFIVCNSDSEPQSRAILNHINKTLRKKGVKVASVEGENKMDWILMDYIHFVIHIFSQEKRNYYNIDRLWGDAKITLIEDKYEK